MTMQISVTRSNGRVVNESNPEFEDRIAQCDFSAKMQNIGEKSIYDCVIVLTCKCCVECQIRFNNHDADIELVRIDSFSATYRLNCPMHPKDRKRSISWNVSGLAALPCIVPIEKTRIEFQFIISGRDYQPETHLVEFNGHDKDGQEKDAQPVT